MKSQTQQYPEFLHPAWNKQSSQVHFTVDARDHVDGLQRERLALLEGFDDKRGGLAGIWLAHNAIIKITTESNGAVKAMGWKWDQGDWKAGCDYEMTGKIVGGTFRSDEQRKNPDTLERDHAMLIVNRQDDLFATKRYINRTGKALITRQYHRSRVCRSPHAITAAIVANIAVTAIMTRMVSRGMGRLLHIMERPSAPARPLPCAGSKSRRRSVSSRRSA
ncbi:hypothetical protein [Bradyrhizobium sp. USDA 3256]